MVDGICKVPKYYVLISAFPVVVQVSGKRAHVGSTEFILSKNTINKQIESFPKSNFDLNQICKIAITQNHTIWSFNTAG